MKALALTLNKLLGIIKILMNNNTKTKHDKCVICHEETEYAEMDHIDARNFYVEGTGQLCQTCFDDCYHEKTEKN